jgi:hypothetical protein
MREQTSIFAPAAPWRSGRRRKAEEQAQEEAILKGPGPMAGHFRKRRGTKTGGTDLPPPGSRLRTLLQNDPQAQALIDLLSDLGLKDNEAHSAVAQLASMKVGRGKRFEWRYDET